ncbi:riboflavin synthase [Campylobacter jejuni]|uniref:Riboflavin synthase n=1 Tax=Campylobacter jejuni TaxID=197 RepID=A0A431GRG2_CAMJU|nr:MULTISPECIES: riboflavin synthase [Campylobacter]ADT66495.1 riboflavin synthase, alpha subunit [Campylobacter jejuni subsp. jejuni ICDCCJ07001]ALF92245.1 6,7-dimethyl-8-ribityllumazine synthase (riboflavin synthase, alpha subunit) [Campylobacter jejuni subsp. jejuni]ALF93881.1 6,7-dimethyl-8-ribityllumazine synthase (riboflavin synthase, alpha subunit) [Campylobacter jejuni subsp. jejuni]AXL47326.1 riboflavin synthase subunit alpha [Campylobacter jejuni]EAB5328899.1 riboflavin synthase [Cam
MFNGLIREIAKVQSYQNNTLSLKAKYRPNLGDSIAVNGACLSVTKLYEGGFEVELSRESRTHIAIENLKDKVHIEPALRYGDRIDGHLMQGHIDFIGTLEKIQKDENGVDFYISLPKEAMKFMAEKGSIGVDGVSLTINEILKNGIRLTIIPITFKETLFKDYQVGRKINIESDLLARYIYAQLQGKNKGLSWEEVERISYLY